MEQHRERHEAAVDAWRCGPSGWSEAGCHIEEGILAKVGPVFLFVSQLQPNGSLGPDCDAGTDCGGLVAESGFDFTCALFRGLREAF